MSRQFHQPRRCIPFPMLVSLQIGIMARMSAAIPA